MASGEVSGGSLPPYPPGQSTASSSFSPSPGSKSDRASIIKNLSQRQASTSTFLLDSLSPSRLASLSAAATYVPSAHAPFSHLPILAPSVPSLDSNVNSKLAAVSAAFASKAKSKRGDAPKVRRKTRETEESLHRVVRNLEAAAPTDTAGQWQLQFMLASKPKLEDKLSICKAATAALNGRRAGAKQDNRQYHTGLDRNNIFTSEANAVRANAKLEVEMFRMHNLSSVLKEVSIITRRRKGLAPGEKIKQIQKVYNPKAPPRQVLMSALEDFQKQQVQIGDSEERLFKKVLKKREKVENLKMSSGGAIVLVEDRQGNWTYDDVNLPDDEDGASSSDDESRSNASSSVARASSGLYCSTSVRGVPQKDRLKLPSIKERYGQDKDDWCRQPVSLRPRPFQADDEAKEGRRSSLGQSANMFAAEKLRRDNTVLLENFSRPDPQVDKEPQRKRIAMGSGGRKPAMVSVAKFVEDDDDDDDDYDEEGVGQMDEESGESQEHETTTASSRPPKKRKGKLQDDVLPELQHFFSLNRLGLGPESAELPVIFKNHGKPSGHGTTPQRDSSEYIDRMKCVWDSFTTPTTQLRLEVNMMLSETIGDPYLIEDFVSSMEILRGCLYYLQVTNMRLRQMSRDMIEELSNAPLQSQRGGDGGGGAGQKKWKQRDVLPNDCFVFLMHENLYFAPGNDHDDTLSWLVQLHSSIISETRIESKKLEESAQIMRMSRCAEFFRGRVQELINRCVFELPQALKTKKKKKDE